MNFVAKTTTFANRKGNLELRADGYRMLRLFPRCILAHWLSGHILNAVALSGPGFKALLNKGFWQRRRGQWVLSFMAVGKTKGERVQEYRDFVDLLKARLPELRKFGAQIVLQLNLGCPNTENPLETLRGEILECLTIARETGLPLMVNFNALVPAQLLLELEQSELVDCFWIANSTPYHTEHLGEIVFGEEVSPMRQRGFGVDGGISGPLCLHYTVETVRAARELGVKLPIIAGGGVQSIGAVKLLGDAGASAIVIATAAILLPWRVRRIVQYANKIFAQGEADANSHAV
jgi:dihydroorotate dehydrogenase